MSERQADHPIHPQFLQRWSPRAFTNETLDTPTLLGFLEAARWAPSGYNIQPWRFVWGLGGTPAFDAILATLVEFNRGWAQHAAALVLVAARTHWVPPGKTAAEAQPNASHAFDAGAAWAQLALQASLAGWHAHAAGGFDRAAAAAAAQLPDGVVPLAVVAIGRLGDKSQLPEALQAREFPSPRRPLAEIAGEGRLPDGA